ncbi:hypothetical protein [Brucella rhizosphaerae]|uniref:Uncharacterized protein n=1 Tax=Brucella rhizosphaerae TaxID=571254 RepID=A0A256FPF8_9HYPH|nr:hypothetical protein [Brucella rhizosphaerae]OYR16717.1 hypothetical protein CEV32_4351 [Brucella rhizosphaerae]
MFKLLLISAALMSSSAYSQTIVDKVSDLDAALANQIAADVSENFSDPLSTQIRRLKKSTTHDDSICGQVNTKNQYGGYIGFKSFRYITDRRRIYFDNTGCD